MPEQEMHTTSFWVYFPASFLAQFPDLHATEGRVELRRWAMPCGPSRALLLMCDPHDLVSRLRKT